MSQKIILIFFYYENLKKKNNFWKFQIFFSSAENFCNCGCCFLFNFTSRIWKIIWKNIFFSTSIFGNSLEIFGIFRFFSKLKIFFFNFNDTQKKMLLWDRNWKMFPRKKIKYVFETEKKNFLNFSFFGWNFLSVVVVHFQKIISRVFKESKNFLWKFFLFTKFGNSPEILEFSDFVYS